ncbi:MAG: carboxypeptidase regulatory-like domain-containing protein [Chloroherpetonaceae bacterium]|nr:carboxypeptidase regulatory-like domain-containing protein [Chloroherpetonaceae bacterium]MDW8437994.1 carboxypeptidase regulatory-like domain-containing protein [Chloroherpetonaceae bacterium]
MKTQFRFLWLVATLAFVASCKDDDKGVTTPTNNPGRIDGVVINAVQLSPIPNVTVSLSTQAGSPVGTQQTNAQGQFSFQNLADGLYRLSATIPGFKPTFADSIVVNRAQGALAVIDLFPADTSLATPIGAISGVVRDNNGNPLQGVNIAISATDEALTNGYFASTTSNANGAFSIGAIPVRSSSGASIPSFKVRFARQGFATKVVGNVIVRANQTTQVQTSLSPVSASTQVRFEDDVETDKNWTRTGFWHRQQNNSSIRNSNFPRYVKLAPNDNSNAAIPQAFGGEFAFWYGQDSTGSFIGRLRLPQDSLSGGTSAAPHSGELTSPVINLAADSVATLSFWTWFEIESVNPNASGYDIMEVIVVRSNGSTVSLGRLNPFVDPIAENRRALPFTSGGFNQRPVWRLEEFDLSQFAGQQIRIRFKFDTRDELYNGFRGWFIDNVRVTNARSSGSSGARVVEPLTPARRE